MNRFRSSQSQRIQDVLGPLLKAEERRAVKVATEYFLEQTGDRIRYHVIDVGLRVEKPEGVKQTPLRIVQVIFADYTNRRNIAILVNDKARVVRDETLAYQPSFSEEERIEAREIALRDERVAPIAKQRNVFVSEVSPLNHDLEDPSLGARLIGLRYVLFQKNTYTHRATAVVSVTDQRVVSFQQIEGSQR